jgi:hypothetical protein
VEPETVEVESEDERIEESAEKLVARGDEDAVKSTVTESWAGNVVLNGTCESEPVDKDSGRGNEREEVSGDSVSGKRTLVEDWPTGVFVLGDSTLPVGVSTEDINGPVVVEGCGCSDSFGSVVEMPLVESVAVSVID